MINCVLLVSQTIGPNSLERGEHLVACVGIQSIHLPPSPLLLPPQDLCFNITWAFMWLIACIAWTLGYAALRSDIADVLSSLVRDPVPGCEDGTTIDILVTRQDSYAAAAVSSVSMCECEAAKA